MRCLQVGGLLAVLGTRVHADPCEDLKANISARMKTKNFVLEILPTQEGLPSGAKAVGTCAGGARRIVLLRNGASPTAVSSPSAPAAQADTAPQPKPVPEPSVTKAPLPAEVKAPPPVAVKATPLTPPAPTAFKVPTPTPAPALKPIPPAAVKLPPPPAAPPASVTQTAVVAAPGQPASAMATVIGEPPQAPTAATVVLPEVIAKPTEPAQAAEPSHAGTSLGASVSAFVGRHWRWLWVLLVLPVLAGWWLLHRLAYDSAGLPRGPRL